MTLCLPVYKRLDANFIYTLTKDAITYCSKNIEISIMPPKKKEVISVIASEDEFKSTVLNESDRRLHVIDLHAGWSGPCQQMVPTFKSLQVTIDYFDERVNIVQVDHDYVKDFGSYSKTSKPRFLFFKGGKLLQAIEGCQAPEILKAVSALLPPVSDE